MEHSYVYEMRADQPYFFNIIYYDINKENPKADDIAHFHQSLEFVYVAEGTFPVHIQGNTCLLNQGQIAYVQSGQIHYFTTQGDAKVFVLIFGLDYLNTPLNNGQCLLPSIITLSEEKSRKMSALLYCMNTIKEVENTTFSKGIFQCFYGLLSEYELNEPNHNSSKFPIQDILKYIDSHYARNLSLRSLAAQFNYAEPYFSSCFKAYLNMSFREYINRVRIGHAKRLISQGMTKNEAAAACGYTSRNTFFRAYNKYHTNYIKEVAENTRISPDHKP